ncbi:hypothetical protein VNI00_010801 [Paramarasmius palmivorus]|uniref:Ricin B lectin domain-containing protein n=1 Tax=Paramarasmius palmivorus TaxID=297713 RepID=A0AAW0CH97_9AGAR
MGVLKTGYYKLENNGYFVALPTHTSGSRLSLQNDDGTSGLKWHIDKHDGGAFYTIFSEYDDVSGRKLGASVSAMEASADICGETGGSKHWIIKAVGEGLAWTNTKDEVVQLETLDEKPKDSQKWEFKMWD